MKREKDLPAFYNTEENINAILEAVSDAIVIVDKEGSIVFVNEQAEKLFEYNREDMYKLRAEDIIPAKYNEYLSEQIQQSGSGKLIRRAAGQLNEVYAVKKSSVEFPVEISSRPLQADHGSYFLYILRDVTGRMQLENQVKKIKLELEQAEKKFKTIIESAPDAMVIVDDKGKIVLINKQAQDMFGYEESELLNNTVEKLMPGRFSEKHIKYRERFTAALNSRPMGVVSELYGIRKNGEEFPVEISLSPLVTSEGRFIASSIRDVTLQRQIVEKIKQVNEELTKQTETLEKNNMELKQFAYIASHDLQAPLRNISGFVQLLQQTYKNKLDEQADDWINRTVNNTKKMEAIIHDILAYSRIDSRARPFRETDLNEVLNEAMIMLETSIKDSKAVITKEYLPAVMGDPSQLTQVFQNLIGNGIKYQGKENPRIHISARENGSDFIIEVKDNGIGISREYHERIFEIFKRLHTHHEYPGTGIGLSICRRIIERHGGKIWVESEQGKGSSFCFTVEPLDKKGDSI